MTALEQYKLLETTGLWRKTPESQRRDVIVSFGEASLVLSSMAGVALTHWSLAALSRLNPRETPAIYTPYSDGYETVEIEDDMMVEAVETVIAAIQSRAPRPWRLRKYLMLVMVFGIAALMVCWFPSALLRHTLSVVPQVTRVQIGDQLLSEIEVFTGSRCSAPEGMRALNRLRMRLVPDLRAVEILPTGLQETVHIPGGYILAGLPLLQAYDDPEVFAGYLVTEEYLSHQSDPLGVLLEYSGLVVTFQLLTTGEVPQKALSEYAEHILTRPQTALDISALVTQFRSAQLSAAAYARTIEMFELSALDPYPTGSPETVLGDGDWIMLQQICEN